MHASHSATLPPNWREEVEAFIIALRFWQSGVQGIDGVAEFLSSLLRDLKY
jgi:hypothetical protein